MSEFRCEATRALSSLKRGSTFLTVHHYTNNFGEVSDFSIVFHVSYRNAVFKSLEQLRWHTPSVEQCYGKPYTLAELSSARMELLDSFQLTLDGANPLTTNVVKAYSIVNNGGGPINGIKLHDKQDILHLNGFRVYRNVLTRGSYPLDKRSAKTIAKDDLRDKLPVGRYVQFKLTPGKFRKLVVAGLTLREEDVVRQVMNCANGLKGVTE